MNIENWNRNNAYNTPKAQMGRFEDAGLNKHLIYGKGTGGLSSPLSSVAPAKQQSQNRFESTDMMQAVGAFNNTMVQQAQTNNLTASAKNTDAKTVGQNKANERYDAIIDTQLDAQKATADLAKQKTITADFVNKGMEQLEAENIYASAEEIKATMATRSRTEQQILINKYKADLAKAGFDPDQPWFAKAIVGILAGGETSLIESIWKMWSSQGTPLGKAVDGAINLIK